jgi:hypothetical protein
MELIGAILVAIVSAMTGAFVGAWFQRRWTRAQQELDTFNPRCQIVGEPPEKQFIRVSARETITITHMEYALADGTLIHAEEVNSEGASINVPVDDRHVLAVQLMPQPQKSNWDNSAPIQFRLHFRVRGYDKVVTLPAWIRTVVAGSTNYRKVVG